MSDALFEHYRVTGDPSARDLLLDRNLGLVYHCARSVTRAAGELAFDELVSAGTLGLIQALESFDPERGIAFSTYATPRIRGAMLDAVRDLDTSSRGRRERARDLAQARRTLEQSHGRAPAPRELADALGIGLPDLQRWQDDAAEPVVVGLSDPVGEAGETFAWEDVIPHPAEAAVAEATERTEMLDVMRTAVAELPRRERTVLALYYYEQLTLRQIGEILHVSESRVSQIRTAALKVLRDRLTKRLEA